VVAQRFGIWLASCPKQVPMEARITQINKSCFILFPSEGRENVVAGSSPRSL